MWFIFLVPLVAIAVIALIGAAIAATLKVATLIWPLLLIALGVWLLTRSGDRHRDHAWREHRHERHWRRHEHRGERAPAESAASVAAATAPEQPVRRPGELPIDLQVKVEQIRRKVEVLLGYADRFPPFSKDLFLVRQTASEYLPRTVEAYLAMSTETAEHATTAEGKWPHQELKEQLELLDAKLDEIAQDLERKDLDRLLANRRFLESRFSERDAGPSTGGTAAAPA